MKSVAEIGVFPLDSAVKILYHINMAGRNLILLFISFSFLVTGCSRAFSTPGSVSHQSTPSKSETLPEIRGMEFSGANSAGYPEYRHTTTGLVFVLLPAGELPMGSLDGASDEQPVHRVTLDSFLIAKYEVTQGVWQKIMGNNPSYFANGENYPVEMISWENSAEFCRKCGLRLPTEAEWEYACRAGTSTRFYWGARDDPDYMWYDGDARYATHPVGEKKPNGFGLYDMSGNVWEWCADWYDPDYYRICLEKNIVHNPRGPAAGKYHVVRGGGWFNYAQYCRSTDRDGPGPMGYCEGNGFRPAADLK